MGDAYHEQLPQEVILYLDWFDQVDPVEVVEAHQDLYQGYKAEDPLRTMLYHHLQHALSIYPSYSLQTRPGGAAELYASFAHSEHASDVQGMLSILVNLWNSDPRGATHVAKLCLTREVRNADEEIIRSVSSDMARRALQSNTWIDDEQDVVYLEVERIRREPPPYPAS